MSRYYTKFGENRIKDKGTVAHYLKCAFDLEVTLTFDLPIIQLHVMNAHTLKHIHTKFGKVVVDGLCGTVGHGGMEGGRDIRVTDLGLLFMKFSV